MNTHSASAAPQAALIPPQEEADLPLDPAGPTSTGDTPKGSAAAGHSPGTAPQFPVPGGLLRPPNGGHSPLRPPLRLPPPSPEAPPWRRTPSSSRSSRSRAGRAETRMAQLREQLRGLRLGKRREGKGRARRPGRALGWGETRPAPLGSRPPLRHLREGPADSEKCTVGFDQQFGTRGFT